MFQATGLCHNKQRPPIAHAYDGPKSIASEGWIPLAAAMVGTVGKKPMWADLGLRPVVGTTVDIICFFFSIAALLTTVAVKFLQD